jgi:hypothetical protein
VGVGWGDLIPKKYKPRSKSSLTQRVFADNKQPHFIPGLREGQIRNREFEAFTISWMPADFATNQDLCVFDAV